MLVWGVKVVQHKYIILYYTIGNTEVYITFVQLLVQLVSCDWWEVTFQMREEWKFV